MKSMKVKLSDYFSPQNPAALVGGITWEVVNIPDGESMAATLNAITQTVFVPGVDNRTIDRAKCGAGRIYR